MKRICTAAACLMAMRSALAVDGVATASISPVRITVVDVTPGDPYTASATLLSGYQIVSAFAPPSPDGVFIDRSWNAEFRSELTADQDSGVSSARVTHDPFDLSASARAQGPAGLAFPNESAVAHLGSGANFSLTPGTQLTFSGTLLVTGDAGSTRGSYARAWVGYLDSVTTWPSRPGNTDTASLVGSTVPAGPFALSLPFSFTVTSGGYSTYGFYETLEVQTATTIPEPASALLMLLGLGLAAARRPASGQAHRRPG